MTALVGMLAQQNLLMGILNVTPDSFSDGGEHLSEMAATQHINELVTAGAHIIDVGAESSRPGSEAVSLSEEMQRLAPVFAAVRAKTWPNVLFSIDTQKPDVMEAAVDQGFGMVNNVAGLAPDAILKKLAQRNVIYVASHLHGEPKSMQVDPLDAVAVRPALERFFSEGYAALRSAGFTHEQIWLDPGIGFGKDLGANLVALQMALAQARHCHVVIGISRKAFIGRLLKLPDPVSRDPGSKMLELGLMLAGLKAVRTHDVALLSTIRHYLATHSTQL